MSDADKLKRWRLILGGDQADGIRVDLDADAKIMDRAMAALYESDRTAGLGSSSPNVPRWLGDIRKYFPKSVVQVMQKDALDRLHLNQMLTEPETLEAIEPDVHLVATLLSMRNIMPAKTKQTARNVVDKVVQELVKKLEQPMKQAIAGALNRAIRNRRPRHSEIDWHRTIQKNLRHYQPPYKTIVPETRIGFGRKRANLRDIILCVDQSGSMAASVVYSGIFAAVMASIPAVKTKLVVFDTAVVDLTEELHDPVELLFSTQLGGGTDINRAVGYCQGLVSNPGETIFVLISDLYEGGVEKELLQRTANLLGSGVQVIVLLALSDEGRPAFDQNLAAKLAAMGAPAFACTPEMFPDLMAAAIRKQDIAGWAAEREIVTSRAET